MKLILTKNKLVYEDLIPSEFPIIHNIGLIADRLLHYTYNDILQYEFLKLLFTAIEHNIGRCECFDVINPPEVCIPECKAIPKLDNVIAYIEEHKEETLKVIYDRFSQFIKLVQLACDNSCNTYIESDWKNLVIPKLPCKCPKDVLKDILPFDTIEKLREYILNITEYLDYFVETNPEIEELLYFSQIKYLNTQDITLWPKEIVVSGFYTVADGGQGTYYLDEQDVTSTNNDGLIYINKGFRYKRFISGDEVHMGWFGAGIGDNDLKIIENLLQYNSIHFDNKIYNLELEDTITIPINSSFQWHGNNSVINIYFNTDLTHVFILDLLQDIYSIKFTGITFNIFGNAENLFGVRDKFSIDLFIFDCKTNINIGKETIKYILSDDTECNSYLEFMTLPLLPDTTSEDENSLCSLKYVNALSNTSDVVISSGYQQINSNKYFTNETKTDSVSTLALIKDDISEEKITTLTTEIINRVKTYFNSLTISITYPVNSYYIQFADFGNWTEDGDYDETAQGNVKEVFNEWQTPEKMYPGTEWKRIALTDEYYLASYNHKLSKLNSSGTVNIKLRYDINNSEKGIKRNTFESEHPIVYKPRSRKCIIWKRVK